MCLVWLAGLTVVVLRPELLAPKPSTSIKAEYTHTEDLTTNPALGTGLTVENYDRLSAGMPIREVFTILGVRVLNYDHTEFARFFYVWRVGPISITIEVRDGWIVTKSQTGLR